MTANQPACPTPGELRELVQGREAVPPTYNSVLYGIHDNGCYWNRCHGASICTCTWNLKLLALADTLERQTEALKAGLALVLHLLPPHPHEGNCNPEHACDSECANAYYMSLTIEQMREALRER